MKRTALCLALLAAAIAQGVAAQTTNNTNAGASSGSSSNSTSASNQNQYVSPSATSSSNQSTNAVSGSSSYGNVGNSTTNTMTPTANSNASSSTSSKSDATNAGNTQVIQFITPGPTTEQIDAQRSAAQAVQGTPTTQNLNMSGGTRSESLNVTRQEGEATQRIVHEGETTQRIEYSGTQTVKNVPSVNGPPLTTSNDTCMGSTSGSINGPGFGLGLGSTWTDRNCVMLKNARELWNMGMKAAAMALFCTDENNRSALEVTGFVCPQTARAQQRAALDADNARHAQLSREAERQQVGSKQVPPALPLELRPPLATAEPARRAVVANVQPVDSAPAAAQAQVAAPEPQSANVVVTPVSIPTTMKSSDEPVVIRVVGEPAAAN
jgi:hypothetical protein